MRMQDDRAKNAKVNSWVREDNGFCISIRDLDSLSSSFDLSWDLVTVLAHHAK